MVEPTRTMGTGVLCETRSGKVKALAMAVPGYERHRSSEPSVLYLQVHGGRVHGTK